MAGEQPSDGDGGRRGPGGGAARGNSRPGAPLLCVRRGGLGDTLLMLPVLHALRRRHAAGPLHFAGVLEFARVLQRFGAVDRALSSEDLQLWALRSDGAAAARARARLAAYRLVVGDDPALAALGEGALVFDPRPARADQPLGLQLLRQLGLDGEAFAPLAAARRPPAADAPIVLAPGSGSPRKNWPRARWLELAAQLAAGSRRLAVVAGPTERDGDDPRRWPWPPATEPCGDRRADDLADWLAGAAALVGNDSGPAHLAAALQVPTVVVFGCGQPAVYAPPGPQVRIVGELGGGPPTAAAGEVAVVLRQLLEAPAN